MKAAAAGYCRPDSLEHAVALLAASDGARLMAGGQSLIASMNLRLSGQVDLIDISRLPELRGISRVGERLVIGSMTTHAEIQTSQEVVAACPMLSEAAGLIAHPAIRNRGTIGGSLCYADPSAEWPACVLALNATLKLASADGQRDVPAEEFFLDLFTTALREDEILTAIEIQLQAPGTPQRVAEISRRKGDYGLAGLALIGGSNPRAAFFSAGPTPILAKTAMARLSQGDIDGAVAALRDDLSPSDDPQASAAYRLHLAGVLLRRVWGEFHD